MRIVHYNDNFCFNLDEFKWLGINDNKVTLELGIGTLAKEFDSEEEAKQSYNNLLMSIREYETI